MKKLTRTEMKNLLGGNKKQLRAISGGSTVCYRGEEPCYIQNGITYKCHVNYTEKEEEECCCGHSAGDDNCYAS